MGKKTEDLVGVLSELTVLEMADLKTALEEKWGVKAAAPMTIAAVASTGAAAPAAVAESSDYQITLSECPADKKIGVIKIVREITGLGLKEAKDLVDGAPKVLKETSPKQEAEEIKKKLEAAGAKAVLKGL